MSKTARLVATAATACLLAALLTVALIPHLSSQPAEVRMRSLSSTDVVAIPAHPRGRPQKRVVVLGDSVGTDTGCACRPFGPRLAQLLAGRLARRVQVADHAQDGQTSAGLVEQLTSDDHTVRDVQVADAVTVVIGANDFDAGSAATSCAGTGTACFDASLAALSTSLDRALARIHALAGPHTRILVMGYWNVFLDGAVGAQQGTAYQQTSDALTRRVDEVIRQGAIRAAATYIDLYQAFHSSSSDDDTALLAADGDHPSAAGHQRIADMLADSFSVAAG
ncbi:MAG: hypothetical protein NVSMB55_09640 [Mycobacteriales bacterium]